MTEDDSRAGSLRRVRVRISGRVQGVGFRYSTRDAATSLGLSGWVRNLPDGDVEAVFQGSTEVVDRMLEWCREGPSPSRVTRVEWSDETPRAEEGPAFDVRF